MRKNQVGCGVNSPTWPEETRIQDSRNLALVFYLMSVNLIFLLYLCNLLSQCHYQCKVSQRCDFWFEVWFLNHKLSNRLPTATRLSIPLHLKRVT